jgi:hypothetical protein
VLTADSLLDRRKLVIVTGGNTGIGYEIVRALCRLPEYRVVRALAAFRGCLCKTFICFKRGAQVMCSRSVHRGKAAQSRLESDGLYADLVQVDISDPLRCVLLEVSSFSLQ